MRAILTYHSIDPSGSVISVDEETFRAHADWFAAGPHRVVSIDDLLSGSESEDCIALTFDDAFVNFESTAWPLLRERGLTATVFVVTGRVGLTNEWGGAAENGVPTLPLLDWDALGRLADEGVVIGSHTRRHPRLAGADDACLEDEVAGSADDLKARLGRRAPGFCYPYGSFDARCEAVVAGTYEWACTTELAPLRAGAAPHRLSRLDAYYYRGPGQLEAWGTATFRARINMRRVARDARSWLAARAAS